jgi:hypothetical protein
VQGKKTHEQHLRVLERKSDVPDRRGEEATMKRAGKNPPTRLPKRDRRKSEFAVSRGGLNQESPHNK